MALLDLALDDDGDLPEGGTYLLTGDALIVQRIRMRLTRFLGEELLDATLGLPFVEWITTKPVPLSEVSALTRREVETIPGVSRVEDWEAEQVTGTRTIRITGAVLAASGAALSLTVLPLGSSDARNRSAPIILVQQRGQIVPL